MTSHKAQRHQRFGILTFYSFRRKSGSSVVYESFFLLLLLRQSSHTIVKQITVEELFGSSLPKDPSLPMMPTQTATAVPSDPAAAYHQNQHFPAPTHQTPMLPPHLAGHEVGPGQRHQVPGLLPAPYALHPSPVFQAVAAAPPRPEPQPLCSVSPLMMPPAGPDGRSAPPGPGAPPTAPAVYMGQEILSSLKPSAAPADVHKPVLAPSFLPSALFPPHKFQEPAGKPILPHGPDIDVYSQQPGAMKPLSVSEAVFIRSCFHIHRQTFTPSLCSPSAGRSHESQPGRPPARGVCASLPERLPAVAGEDDGGGGGAPTDSRGAVIFRRSCRAESRPLQQSASAGDSDPPSEGGYQLFQYQHKPPTATSWKNASLH